MIELFFRKYHRKSVLYYIPLLSITGILRAFPTGNPLLVFLGVLLYLSIQTIPGVLLPHQSDMAKIRNGRPGVHTIGGFLKKGYPKIIKFNGFFSIKQQFGGYPKRNPRGCTENWDHWMGSTL